jgi:hypothetical protein
MDSLTCDDHQLHGLWATCGVDPDRSQRRAAATGGEVRERSAAAKLGAVNAGELAPLIVGWSGEARTPMVEAARTPPSSAVEASP